MIEIDPVHYPIYLIICGALKADADLDDRVINADLHGEGLIVSREANARIETELLLRGYQKIDEDGTVWFFRPTGRVHISTDGTAGVQMAAVHEDTYVWALYRHEVAK